METIRPSRPNGPKQNPIKGGRTPSNAPANGAADKYMTLTLTAALSRQLPAAPPPHSKPAQK